MIATQLLALYALFTPGADGPVCPIMGSPVNLSGPATEYNGVRYRYCCGGCQGAFEADPQKALSSEKLKGKVVGVFLFDPVTGRQVTTKTAKGGSSDFNGIRFHFLTKANKDAFDADPKKYGVLPKKEALYCPVLNVELKNYYGSNGYVDYEGARYYVCCDSCFGTLKANPEKYVGKAAPHVKAPRVFSVNAELAKATGIG